MAEGKRPRKRPNSNSDGNYTTGATGVTQLQNIIFDDNVDYEDGFEQNMRFLEASAYFDVQAQQAWNNAWQLLVCLKAKWLFYQNRASLAMPIPTRLGIAELVPKWDSYWLRDKYQRMYAYALRFPDWAEARIHLIKESMIAEWPRTFTPFSDSGEVKTEVVDRAPVLRMSIKATHPRVRRWHPTVQLRVLALNKQNANIAHARFTAQLVTQTEDKIELNKAWVPIGRLVLTEREGEMSVTKRIEVHDRQLVLSFGYNEHGSLLQFDNSGTLCAAFTDLGTDTGEKKKASVKQRYCIEIISEITLIDGLQLKHSTLSHPFLVVANNEQNKTVLGDITWDILSAEPTNIFMDPKLRRVTWHRLKLMLRHYVQSQLIEARELDNDELLHIQCMLFLPLAFGQNNLQQIQIERELFGFEEQSNRSGIKKLKYRLLRESVRDDYLIDQELFLTRKCVDLNDCVTELQHSVWEWLFEAVELIIDRNNASLLCEDFSVAKQKKEKKSSMMLKLFNDRVITMSSRERVWKVYKVLSMHEVNHVEDPRTLAILIRFNESELGSLSFAYSNLNGSEFKPTYGSMKAKEIKQIPNGLIGMIMEAEWPVRFDRLVRFDCGKGEGKSGATFPLKQEVFVGYEPKATNPAVTEPSDQDPFKIDPLRGPVEFRGAMRSPSYGDFSSNPATPLPPQQAAYNNDMFGKGDDVRFAASGLTKKFAALSTVSSIESKSHELIKNKHRYPNSPDQNEQKYDPLNE